MSELSVYIATFNCGRTPINIEHFSAGFFNGLTTNLPPDLVVLSLQEIAPLGYSFIGGSLLAPYLSRFTTAVNAAASRRFEDVGEYVEVSVKNVGMIGEMVLARPSVAERLRWVEVAGVGVGNYELGNKGAVGVRLGLMSGGGDEPVVVTFVAAHLAPMEWDWERRNQDWKNICRGLVFSREGDRGQSSQADKDGDEAEPLLAGDEDGSNTKDGLYAPASYLFVAGDLNYRTSDIAPNPDAHKSWPSHDGTVSDMNAWSYLWKKDQLAREKQAGKTLHHLAEPEIKFPPTYKLSSAAQDNALGTTKQSTVNETSSSPWAKHRVPSWCDRILYLAAAPPKVDSYTALPVQPTSDHRPVAMSCSIPLKPLDLTNAGAKAPSSIRPDWQEARAAAKRYEMAVGVGAYLTWTWEGEALLAGSVVGLLGGYLALRAMLGT